MRLLSWSLKMVLLLWHLRIFSTYGITFQYARNFLQILKVFECMENGWRIAQVGHQQVIANRHMKTMY